ncbi:MAG TPA: aminoacyl-tRNA hydrolase [Acidimicrobiales bacterium]|nr:aminoacyl-tRNA hydrolase [Acidimicrobiales bacterium]
MALLGRRRAPARGAPADLVVVGLANPGPDYAGSRHNVGAEVVERLVERTGARLKQAVGRSHSAEVRIDGRLVVLAVPGTYMNLSGEAVGPLVRRYCPDDLSRLVVVHDELDLPPGRIRVKVGGGLAGHNGLKSIKAHLHGDGFVRVRIGVGKPPGRQAGADYVLRRPGKADRAELDVAVAEAADAVECILAEGPERAMSRFN